MCYFTKRVLNKRFLPNRKNRWNPPVCTDERFKYVEVECGHCFECRKKKRREWRIKNYRDWETGDKVKINGASVEIIKVV